MKTHVTAKIVDQFLQMEQEFKEKAMTMKESLKKFMAQWKKAWVAQDEPQVSVGGLLDRNFG